MRLALLFAATAIGGATPSLAYRGKVVAKGKGEIDMYFIAGPRAAQ